MRRGLTFDDVCLVNPLSEVESRTSPSITSRPSRNITIGIPIVNSPMDSVINESFAEILSESGSIPIFHRFQDLTALKNFSKPFFVSVGINYEFIDLLVLRDQNSNFMGVNLDVANGHTRAVLKATERLAEELELEVMAGAVCTPWGYRDLVSAGATSVRVGVGPGSACITRLQTGVGVPQFTAVSDIYQERKRLGVPFICDGGIRNSGDIVKALAAGADCVMIGRLFAQTRESAAPKRGKVSIEDTGVYESGPQQCLYRGQASLGYQIDHYGKVKTLPEGESSWLPIIGKARDLIDELCAGLKTGMAYCNASNLDQLRQNAEFMEVTSTYREESRARILG